MSAGERAAAIPDAAGEAFCEVLFKWQPALRHVLDDTALDEALAAAAPFLAGGGEAERLRLLADRVWAGGEVTTEYGKACALVAGVLRREADLLDIARLDARPDADRPDADRTTHE